MLIQYFMNCLRCLLILLFCFVTFTLSAQIPTDLSNVKASQITDAQLQQYLNQAKAAGLTQDQLESELLRRGLPQTELTELKNRIQQLSTNPGVTDISSDNTNINTTDNNFKRKLSNPLLNNSNEFLKLFSFLRIRCCY